MAGVFDLERAWDSVIQAVKDNLNTRIAAINTDKADDITLANVPTDQYYYDFTEKINNVNLLVYHPLLDSKAEGIGPATRQTFELAIFVMDSNDLNITGDKWRRKSLRYSRAVQESIQKTFGDDGRISTLKITTFLPALFQQNRNSPLYKIGGVQVTGMIS